MESLPPVKLGAHILAAFAAALLLRYPLEKRLVDGADEIAQPTRQFVLDPWASGRWLPWSPAG